jgi:RNA polymerase sigma-70 factor (sigma-E family)
MALIKANTQCGNTVRRRSDSHEGAVDVDMGLGSDATNRRQTEPFRAGGGLRSVSRVQQEQRERQFALFVAAQSAPLVHFARLLCGDPHQAQDLVQSALEKVYKVWRRHDIGHPVAYARRAVLNQYLSGGRRRWRESPVSDPSDHHDMAAPDHAAGVLDREAILGALSRLTARERAVIVLRYEQDLTEAATAELLGIQIGTVKSTASRAIGKLRRSPDLIEMTHGRDS